MRRNKKIALIISMFALLGYTNSQAEQPIERPETAAANDLSSICQSSADSLTFTNPEQSQDFVNRCIAVIKALPVDDQLELDDYIVDDLLNQCHQQHEELEQEGQNAEEQINACVATAALQWLASSPKQIEEE